MEAKHRRIHCLTHPEYRDVGVSGMLVREIIEVAQHAGLTRLEAEFNGERATSIRCFESAGFREMLRMKDYLKEHEGRLTRLGAARHEDPAGFGQRSGGRLINSPQYLLSTVSCGGLLSSSVG